MRIRVTTASGRCNQRSHRRGHNHFCVGMEGPTGNQWLPAIVGSSRDVVASSPCPQRFSCRTTISNPATSRLLRSSSAQGGSCATPIADEIRKLTTDPGARRLAQYMDQLKERLDTCCHHRLRSKQSQRQRRSEARPVPVVSVRCVLSRSHLLTACGAVRSTNHRCPEG